MTSDWGMWIFSTPKKRKLKKKDKKDLRNYK